MSDTLYHAFYVLLGLAFLGVFAWAACLAFSIAGAVYVVFLGMQEMVRFLFPDKG